MRLWTLHPRYLDAKGLVAAWREALLAQKVLSGTTSGYKHHPQLIRFRMQNEPVQAIAAFLTNLYDEAKIRGYHFDNSKITPAVFNGQIEETSGQLQYEWLHLKRKLELRSPDRYNRYRDIAIAEPNPLFTIVPGDVNAWEKI
jgi:hypothetical protein